MTMDGFKNTLPVTLDRMVIAASSVRRGTDRIFVVGDMPFGSYQVSHTVAVESAVRFIKETGCDAVKCEASKKLIDRFKAIVDAEMLVMGHIGLNPQKIHEMGGHRIQGKTVVSAQELLETALMLQKAGAFALLLEGVTEEVSQIIHAELTIPVYGIGSGRKLDGQLLIGHDLMGLYSGFKKMPIYIRQWKPVAQGDRTVGELVEWVIQEYVSEVKAESFPGEENVHHVPAQESEAVFKMFAESGLIKKGSAMVAPRRPKPNTPRSRRKKK